MVGFGLAYVLEMGKSKKPMKFNQNKYIQQYNKEHYKAFKVDLRKEEYEALELYLRKIGITKAQFLRQAMKDKNILQTNVLTNK